MIYMLISEICIEHASILYILASASQHFPRKICSHYYKRIIISNYSYKKICDEHMVDMLLPLNTIDEFLITGFIDIKRVHYNVPSYVWTYHY
jgi:hypothetical protein